MIDEYLSKLAIILIKRRIPKIIPSIEFSQRLIVRFKVITAQAINQGIQKEIPKVNINVPSVISDPSHLSDIQSDNIPG